MDTIKVMGRALVNFETALAQLKGLKSISRESWDINKDGKDINYVFMVRKGDAKQICSMHTQTNYISTYAFTTQDILAEDWFIL